MREELLRLVAATELSRAGAGVVVAARAGQAATAPRPAESRSGGAGHRQPGSSGEHRRGSAYGSAASAFDESGWPADAGPVNGEAARRGSRGPGALSAAQRAERAFLAQCVATPDGGAEALAAVDEELWSDDVHRRASQHLREHLAAPGEGLPDDDPPLSAFVAGLVAKADELSGSRAAVRAQLLELRVATLQREIDHAKAAGQDGIADRVKRRDELARERDELIGEDMELTRVEE